MAAKHNPPKRIRTSKLDPYTLLSTYDVGLVLDVTPPTVRAKIHQGLLPAKMDNGHFRILKKDLAAYIDALPSAASSQGAR